MRQRPPHRISAVHAARRAPGGLAWLLIAGLASMPAGAETLLAEVDNRLDALASLLGDAYSSEHADARVVRTLGDALEPLVVTGLTIEGREDCRNCYTQYIAVFASSIRPGSADEPGLVTKLRLLGLSPVGGKGWRAVDVESVRIDGNELVFEAREYARDADGALLDAYCCPSIASTVAFQIVGTALVEG